MNYDPRFDQKAFDLIFRLAENDFTKVLLILQDNNIMPRQQDYVLGHEGMAWDNIDAQFGTYKHDDARMFSKKYKYSAKQRNPNVNFEELAKFYAKQPDPATLPSSVQAMCHTLGARFDPWASIVLCRKHE